MVKDKLEGMQLIPMNTPLLVEDDSTLLDELNMLLVNAVVHSMDNDNAVVTLNNYSRMCHKMEAERQIRVAPSLEVVGSHEEKWQ